MGDYSQPVTETVPSQDRKPVRVETREELDELIAAEERLLVDIYSSGCPKCQAIEPVLGTVAKVSDVTVALFNPQHHLETVSEFDIRSTPTLLLFEDGELVDRLAEGFQGTDAILAFVDAER